MRKWEKRDGRNCCGREDGVGVRALFEEKSDGCGDADVWVLLIGLRCDLGGEVPFSFRVKSRIRRP